MLKRITTIIRLFIMILSSAMFSMSRGQDSGNSTATGFSDIPTEQNLAAYFDSKEIRRNFDITCCENARPTISRDLKYYMTKWHVKRSKLLNPAHADAASDCAKFTGSYQLQMKIINNAVGNTSLVSQAVYCNCPTGKPMDRNCRSLTPCRNGGHRAFSIGLRCACPDKYFGENCQHYCLKGERMKNEEGVDHCVCERDWIGRSCDQVVCHNGGVSRKSYCKCQRPFVGLHCQANLNTPGSSRIRKSTTLHNDLTGTVLCLFLIITLILGMYYLVRRRNHQHQRRRSMLRNSLSGGLGRGFHQQNNSHPQYRHQQGRPPPELNSADASSDFVDINSSNSFPTTAHLAAANNLVLSYPPPPSYDDAIKLTTTPANAIVSTTNLHQNARLCSIINGQSLSTSVNNSITTNNDDNENEPTTDNGQQPSLPVDASPSCHHTTIFSSSAFATVHARQPNRQQSSINNNNDDDAIRGSRQRDSSLSNDIQPDHPEQAPRSVPTNRITESSNKNDRSDTVDDDHNSSNGDQEDSSNRSISEHSSSVNDETIPAVEVEIVESETNPHSNSDFSATNSGGHRSNIKSSNERDGSHIQQEEESVDV